MQNVVPVYSGILSSKNSEKLPPYKEDNLQTIKGWDNREIKIY